MTSVAFTDDDLWASIGAKQEQHQFAQRTLALSDPDAYNRARNTAMNVLKGSTASTFAATYQNYVDAGYSPSESKKLATAAAKQAYDVGKKALHASFPSAIDNVYQSASTTKAVALGASRSSSKSSSKKSSSKRKKKRR